MSKNKLRRFAENVTFPHMVQPQVKYPPTDHELKGNWNKLFFENDNPIVLELGCGRGEYTVEMAQHYPEKNFIGIDWKGARLWKGAKTTHLEGMKNAGFLRIQIQNIGHFFAPHEVGEIWITFPDPQPQKSRERKRLTSPRFLDKYIQLLSRGGAINLKTDNAELYNYSLEVAKKYRVHFATDDLYGAHQTGLNREVLNIKTTYEKRFLKEGFKICYLRFSFE